MTELTIQDVEIQSDALKMGEYLVPFDAFIGAKVDQSKTRKTTGGVLIFLGILMLLNSSNGWIGFLGFAPLVFGFLLWGGSSKGWFLEVTARGGNYRVIGDSSDDLNQMLGDIGRAVAGVKKA